MKLYPEPKLPLKPDGLWERYLLFTFEGREKWIGAQIGVVIVFLIIWAVTQFWPWFVLAIVTVMSLHLSIEARAVSRMIRRAAFDHERPAS